MGLRQRALILVFLVLTWGANRSSFGGGTQYDPPPLPDPPFDIPFPDDPPDLFTDPFDPINDLPDPFDIPFPPEDPLDRSTSPFRAPPDFDDPIMEPSLLPTRSTTSRIFRIFRCLRCLTSRRPLSLRPRAGVRLPHGRPDALPDAGCRSTRVFRSERAQDRAACDAAAANTLLVAESKNNTVLFLGTCPNAISSASRSALIRWRSG